METLRLFHSCYGKILQSMAVLPQEQLQNAIQRGFQFWTTYRQTTTPELLLPIFQTIVDQARIIAGAEMAALGIVKSPFESFNPWVYSGVSPEIVQKLGAPPRPIGTLGFVANQGESIRITDITKHPAFIGLPANHPTIKSLLAVPVRYGQLNLGNLYLANKINASEFSEDDQNAIKVIAELASSALQQAYFHSIYQLQESQMTSILDSTTVGILFVNTQKQNIISNAAVKKLFGRIFDKTDDYKSLLKMLSYPNGRPLSESEFPLTKALHGETSDPNEFIVTQPNGNKIPIISSAAPIKGLQNRILGGVIMFENIAAAKELAQLRQDFTAMLAHDLKNPANVILMSIQMHFQKKEQNENQKEISEEITISRSFLKQIEKNTQQIIKMIDEFLDATKLGVNSLLKLNLVPMNLFEATKQILENILPEYDGHEIILIKNDSELPFVNIDVARYEEIIMNLVSNAAKYSTPKTPIQIKILPANQSTKKGVSISVEDQGIGIPKEEQPFIFDRYFRSNQITDSHKGFGLGLFIAKGLTNAHNGIISVESEPGKGSSFNLWFPAT